MARFSRSETGLYVPTTEAPTPFTDTEYKKASNPNWREAVRENLRRQEFREYIAPERRGTCRLEWEADRYKAIVFSGDWHIGSEGWDAKKWEDDMETILAHPDMKLFLMGDLIDNFTWTPGAFEQMINPQEQVNLLGDFLEEAIEGNKVLAYVGGNHTMEWLLKNAGLEFGHVVAGMQKIPHLTQGGLFYLDVFDIHEQTRLVYTILARHRTRYNSSFNPNHGNRRAFRMEATADIVVSGHTHQLVASDEWVTANGKPYHTFLIKSGCYKAFDRYASQKGIPKSQTGSAVAIISPHGHEIFVTTGVQRGKRLLDALNG